MTIPFKNIPDNLRLPFMFAEIDPSKANTSPLAQRSLLTFTADVPVICPSQSDARAAAGTGSILAGMIDAYRAADPTGEMWALPLVDDAGGTAATGAVTFTGTSTAAGTVPLYIGGHSIPVALASGTTAAQAATAVAAAITAAIGIPVTAAAVSTAVNLTARNKGECGNDIDLRVAYKGTAGGEAMPAGLTVAFTAMSAGATNPVLTTGLTNLNDTPFDFIVCSLTDATSLAAIAGLLNDTTGRWAWSAQVYGHCWIAKRASSGTNASFATALNNQHITNVAFTDSPTPAWKWAAAFAGVSAVSIRKDPGQPLQFLTVPGLLAPPLASRWSLLIRNNTLLYGGCSTWTVDPSGVVVIENMITTYVTNTAGQPDNSYLEVEPIFTSMYVLRRLSTTIQTKFGRSKKARDGTRLLPGSNVVTPSIVKLELVAGYRQMEAEGYVQNSDAFAAGVSVEEDPNNPSRFNILYPATLIGQLRVLAVLFQFRLA